MTAEITQTSQAKTQEQYERLRNRLVSSGLFASDIADLGDQLLEAAIKERATDIHIDPRLDATLVRFRVDGVIVDAGELPHDRAQQMVNQLKTLGGLDPMISVTGEEGRWAHMSGDREFDIRLSVIGCLGGEKAGVRMLDRERAAYPLEELGMSKDQLARIDQWLCNCSGLFLVGGPVGTGKTTTPYALVERLLDGNRLVMTVEDPIEYRIERATQVQVNEQRGLTFAEGIKAMMRLDPDALLVGETRDPESADAAVTAAASGHVLLSTLHSRDAVGAITNLRSWEMPNHAIAALLSVVVSQRLVRKLCTQCREQRSPEKEENRWAEFMGLSLPDQIWVAHGCSECGGMGYRGRTGLFEVWMLDEADGEAISSHADERTIRARLMEKGHKTLHDSAVALLADGVTTVDAIRAAGGLGPISTN